MSKRLLVFDMDGVLVDVTESYRETIRQTVHSFTGQWVSHEQIQDYKNRGGWNNDWQLSQRLCQDVGRAMPYETVISRFNELFFGAQNDGLIARERWLPKRGLLEGLASRYPLAIFTGRVAGEARVTLDKFCPAIPFDPIMSDDIVTASKPAPDGLRQIQARHPGHALLYFGDTVDDAQSAHAAGVPFIGIASANHPDHARISQLLWSQGALAVLDNINQIEEVLG